MFYRITLILISLTITGCKSLAPLQNETEKTTNLVEEKTDHSQFIAAVVTADDPTDYYDIAKVTPDNQSHNHEQAVYGDVWKRIQAQLTFPIPENRRLKIQRAWYAKHPDYLNRVAKRAEPFLYYIVEQIENRGLPMELALLPIVESAFDPFAYSPGRASGLWQFVPGTAERFGLRQDWWFDGRRDVIDSTKAALDYLEKLHQQFDGNWLHALASYNSGEGRVARAIQKNYRAGENIDFWSLELPRETDAYVPKLLALADIIKRPHKYNISIYPITNEPVIASVEAKSQIDLALAANLAEMDVNALHRLNPGYNRWATAPEGPHRFILPIDNAKLLESKLAQLNPDELLTWVRYKIKSGDSLGKIANTHKTSIDVIKTANKLTTNTIRIGDFLMIPASSIEAKDYQLSFNQRTLAKQSKIENNSVTYKVKKGDTFWDISRAHNTSVKTLAKWNNMAPGDPIYPGQELKIKLSDNDIQLASAPTTKKVNYTVRRGDSLALIAQKFKVSIKEIETWNKITRKRYLQPGQKLNLHVDITQI